LFKLVRFKIYGEEKMGNSETRIQDDFHPLERLVKSLRNQQMMPQEIEQRSFQIIAGLLPQINQHSPEWRIVQRVVHSTGDPMVADFLRIHPDAVQAALSVILKGCTIVTDVRMSSAGISKRLIDEFGCDLICAIDQPTVVNLASRAGITRGTAAMVALAEKMDGSIVVIGNAPTALFAVIDLVKAGAIKPALIVGTPVGFVGAAESKAELAALVEPKIPFVTLEGSRGGSGIAVSIVNALLKLAKEARDS
jgi:precorrin-8X/cobalt-precorrin-8 methylmutase